MWPPAPLLLCFSERTSWGKDLGKVLQTAEAWGDGWMPERSWQTRMAWLHVHMHTLEKVRSHRLHDKRDQICSQKPCKERRWQKTIVNPILHVEEEAALCRRLLPADADLDGGGRRKPDASPLLWEPPGFFPSASGDASMGCFPVV